MGHTRANTFCPIISTKSVRKNSCRRLCCACLFLCSMTCTITLLTQERYLQGAIDWPTLLTPICNYSMHLLRVPVGNYVGPGSSGAKITSLAFSTIAPLACNSQRNSIEHLGKLLIYSIRPNTSDTDSHPQLCPVAALKKFLTLLEHFYQVPNAGEYVPTRICV